MLGKFVKSSNGTFVNDERLDTEAVWAKFGQQRCVSLTLLQFHSVKGICARNSPHRILDYIYIYIYVHLLISTNDENREDDVK
jgi:hypothetical protein